MRIAFLLVILCPVVLLSGQYWQQDVHYTISATLNAKTHVISGTEQLLYTNKSPDTLTVVYYRLYWNLFTPGSHGQKLEESLKSYYLDTTGGMWLKKFAILEGGVEQTPEYTVDNTLVEVRLAKPLLPGATATFVVDWDGRVPEGGNRTGHQGRDYNIAQWYPQIATYDKYGWDKSQYLGPAEFHNEYGTFDVAITLPRSFTLGFTGSITNPEEVYPDSVLKRLKESEGNTETVTIADYSAHEWKDEDTAAVTWKFHAENVRDFAWVANEHYIWDVAHWTPPSGSRSIAIHALYVSDFREFWKEAARFGQHAISFYSQHYGLYMYPSMFLVEGVIGGGMEYPGITFYGHYGDKNDHGLFGVISHEVGHNWYPMMIGSDETYYAFMDEGFTTFITSTSYEDFYGRFDNEYTWTEWYQKLLSFPNDAEREAIQIGVLSLQRTGYEDPIATHTYRFTEPNLAGGSIYGKTASVMMMLRYVLGPGTFEAAMKEYYNRWRFKHPYPEDFYAVCEEVSGQRDLRWFFDEWFNRTATFDYGIGGLRSTPVPASGGGGTAYHTKVHIRRYRPAIMPVDVLLHMENGQDTTVWLGVDKWLNAETKNTVEVDLPSRALRAELNPGGDILDMNRLNNRTSLPKVDVAFDNTLMQVTHIDAYDLRWRPSVWYTDIGGWDLGAKMTGSYLDELARTSLWTAYNFNDRTLNYSASLDQDLGPEFRSTTASASYYRIEGRKGATLSLQKGFNRNFSMPPFHWLTLTYSFSQADNPEYLLHPFTWQEGILHRVIGSYDYSNRSKFATVHATLALEASTSLFGRSDFQYSKRTIELKTNIFMPGSWTLAARYFSGVGSGEVPNQTKYYLAGGSPLEQMNAPFYRSKGMLPSNIRDHAIYPGGGLMRGYFNLGASAEKIDAFNVEGRFPTAIPFLRVPIWGLDYLLEKLRTTLFFDAGRIADGGVNLGDRRFEVDWGFGVRLASFSWLFGPFSRSNLFSAVGLSTIRVDFPLYVSNPPRGEKRLKFRWVVSLSEPF